MSSWLPVLDPLLRCGVLEVAFLIVDQCAAMSVLKIRGSAAAECFIYSKKITRHHWRDSSNMRFIDSDEEGEWELDFEAGVINPPICESLRLAVVVPPLFHMYQNIQQFVVTTFCQVISISEY